MKIIRNSKRILSLLVLLALAFGLAAPFMAAASSYPYPQDNCPGHKFGPWTLNFDSTHFEWGSYSTRVAPSCTTEGYGIRTCNLCAKEDSERQLLPALGHSWGDWALTTAPDCTTKGQETRTCHRCGDTQVRDKEALGHNFGPWVITKEATCTIEGTKTSTCTRCGDVKTEIIPATGHSFGAWTQTKAPTCLVAGEETRTCPVDNVVETRAIPATGHSFGAWTVSKPATCTTDGEEKRTCPVDNVVETRVIKATGHTFGPWTQTKAPTCTAAGEEKRTCPIDNAVETRPIKATGHEFGPWTRIKEPSCTEKGEETRTCPIDNVVEKREIAHLPHTPSKMWYALREPTLTEKGVKYRICDVCKRRLDSVEYAPKGYQYGLVALNFGPYVKNLKPVELSTFVDRFTPMDFNQEGETQWPIITQDGYYIGMLKMNVFQGDLTVSYVMNDPVTVVTHEILFLHEDGMAVTAGDLNNVIETLKFNEPIPLMGLEERVLNVRLSVNYDQENAANRPFSDTGLYLDGVTQNALLLQDMTDKLMQGPLGD